MLNACLCVVLHSFQFSPTANGMYTETWVLHTHPNTPQGPHHLTLRAAAVGPNVLGRERRKVSAMLAEKEKSAKVQHSGPCFCLSAFALLHVICSSGHLVHDMNQ